MTDKEKLAELLIIAVEHDIQVGSDNTEDMFSFMQAILDWHKEEVAKLLYEVSKVYVHITGGLLSYPDYDADTVITVFEDRNYDKGITQDDVRDMLRTCDTLDDLVFELKSYFGLEQSQEDTHA